MKSRSKKWNVARGMPPLRHSVSDETFDVRNSEVVQWLIQQPDILQMIFEVVKNHEIVYDNQTGKWRGVDYAN